MKQYITNSVDIYERVTNETSLHYICGNNLYLKEDVITDYYPLDDVLGKLHLYTVSFYN